MALRFVQHDGGDGVFALNADFVGHGLSLLQLRVGVVQRAVAEQTFELVVGPRPALDSTDYGVLTEPGSGRSEC